MKVVQVLNALAQPVTKKEIAEVTGLAPNQVRNALDVISRETPLRKMGSGSHIHYWIPAGKRKLKHKFRYRELLNLIDTGEWWTMHEICMILLLTPMEVGNCISNIKRWGHAEIISERHDGRSRKYKVIRNDG